MEMIRLKGSVVHIVVYQTSCVSVPSYLELNEVCTL